MKNSNFFEGIKLIKPNTYSDKRGFFLETYNKIFFKNFDISDDFVQDNLSFSKKKGTIRGLHFQKEPFSQSKLLRVLDGQIQDVFIDLRKNSKTFEIAGSEILGPEEGWIYIPHGFAHGFCTLTDNVKILYKVDSYYSEEMESGIKWDDDFFNIDWMIDYEKVIISEKDQKLPLWGIIKNAIEF